MSKKQRLAAIILATGSLSIGALQFIPAPARLNPPINHHLTLQASMPVPEEVASILRRSCMDCHSNGTRWPWYSGIAPLSWGVTNDVARARKAMNFSEWKTGAGRQPGTAVGYLNAICAGVKAERMPPMKYSLLHQESRLSASDRHTLCAWTNREMERYTQTKRLSRARN